MRFFQSANRDTQCVEGQGDFTRDRADTREHVAFGAR
jgi:hypothetical protein